MPFTPGSRHGAYQIGELLGKGGMGEVFLARDTKLNRDVAVKALPESFARDPGLMARFEREARTLASLNHPNIAHLYGLENWDGAMAIVMELVPGSTLRDRIKQGPVPLEEALAIARQISAALEAAHDQGVIHRDLKPANVKITPEGVVKLLDFGLAKTAAEERPALDPDNSPTATMEATQAGVILGTAGYMAPEQVRGTHVDKRADIWAFGVVLYELLTGRKAFTGATATDLLAASLRADPDWTALPAGTPHEIRRLLERCLERDRQKRLRDIGDAWLLPEETPIQERPASRPAWLWLALGFLLAAGGAAVFSIGRQPADPSPALRRFNVDLGGEIDLRSGRGPAVVLSADGARMAMVAGPRQGSRLLYTRRLDQAEPRLLAGTDDARVPFFSPDGRWIGFFAEGKLKKISVDGGPAVTLCDLPEADTHVSAVWAEGDRIVASLGGRLVQLSAAGGNPRPLTTLASGESLHGWPQILPGGKTALFSVYGGAYASSGSLEVVTLATGERKPLRQKGTFGRYISTGGNSGHLTWVSQGTLFAAPMDLDRLELTGASRPVLDGVDDTEYSAWGAQIDFAADGTAMYLPRHPPSQTALLWLDEQGKTKPILAKPGNYSYPALSADGKQLAYLQQVGGNRDIWVHDLDRDLDRRITFSPENEYVFVWTPDSRWIVFSLGNQIRAVRSDGGSEPITLHENKSSIFVHAISADGKDLAFCEPSSSNDLWTASLEGFPDHPRIARPQPFQATRFNEIYAGFSLDGKWLAYASDESGLMEVYARPFPGGPGKFQVSIGGGVAPVWSPNGRELFFRSREDQITVVDYKANGNSLTLSKPRVWSERRIHSGANLKNYSVAPDGKRLAVALQDDGAVRRSHEVVMLENLPAELRRGLAK